MSHLVFARFDRYSGLNASLLINNAIYSQTRATASARHEDARGKRGVSGRGGTRAPARIRPGAAPRTPPGAGGHRRNP
ncbi:hypothetical protein Ssi03_56240 [Sphaerisporangium siamense]|nr:hypothetical protein Ssi03_56240 [Sphaerisporangium siamense]